MVILYAFLVGGLICAIAQIIMDKLKIMPIYVTCLLVVIGALLDFFSIYDKLVEFAHMGAMIPISSFGHAICHGVYEEIQTSGFMDIFTGIFKNVNVGITSAIFFAFIAGILVKPKG